eukprot:9034319-Alexandrium_andersonii.AAC.1
MARNGAARGWAAASSDRGPRDRPRPGAGPRGDGLVRPNARREGTGGDGFGEDGTGAATAPREEGRGGAGT